LARDRFALRFPRIFASAVAFAAPRAWWADSVNESLPRRRRIRQVGDRAGDHAADPASISARILREAGFEAQVAAAIAGIAVPSGTTLAGGVRRLFKREPAREWPKISQLDSQLNKDSTSKPR
jgi:hypothetical protein